MIQVLIELITIFTALSTLSTPTYSELLLFLNRNEVNKAPYVYGEHVCWNFACDLLSDAHDEGMNMVYIGLEFEHSAHAIVAVLTSDHGVVFIEPQSDLPAHLEEGFDYWTWFYGPFHNRDDTIVNVSLYGSEHCGFMEGTIK